MARVPMWRRYARFFGSNIHQNIDEELQFHLDSKIAEFMDQGWSEEAARDEARREFGDIASVYRSCSELP